MSAQDTIAAVATAPGKGAVGILRLSGLRAFDIAAQMAGALPVARTAVLRKFHDAQGSALDQGLLLSFARPHSFTGEDVAELQGHGGPVVLDLLLRASCELGARVARPGEFSERAFLNGRLDLAQAEAIADLIDAGSAQAARAAQRSLEGEFSRQVKALVETLTQLRVHVEGALDFSDEDVNWLADTALHQRIAALLGGVRDLLSKASSGRRLREGLVIALAGRPNVGKSTLMNRLAEAEVAIVTDIPGTTRDVLRENLNLGGLPVTLVDTAGLRPSSDPIELEGIRRAREAIEKAEVILWVTDALGGLTQPDAIHPARVAAGQTRLIVHNKCDLSGHAPAREETAAETHLYLSARTGAGIELLVAEIKTLAGYSDAAEGLFSARTRHVDALRRAHLRIQEAQSRLRTGQAAELAAEELRLAQQALGEITGAVSSDDLLGRVFSQFCIGK